jgi:hypothetical protein
MNQLSYHVLSDRFSALGFEFTGSLQRGIAETMELLKASNTVNPFYAGNHPVATS